MEVFRICHEKYAGQLTSSGSANRWNVQGQNVIYTGSSRSLSTLELVVHRNAIVPTFLYKVMVISIADEDSLIKQVRLSDLPPDWRSLNAYSKLQRIGSEWYRQQETLLLKVPSAIISQEYNYVINTEHPDFASKVQLVRTENYFWDNRLL
ncbi:MAG: RES family NAD+ phosphorylase [Spirosomataceae bacterium]